MKIEEIALMDNCCDILSKEELVKIAEDCIQGYEFDKRSRAEWDSITDKVMEIAKQTMKKKGDLGEVTADVKYPLITTAALSVHSRAYQEVIRNNKVVHAAFTGSDPDQSLEKLCNKIANFMSWQLLVESDSWEPSIDRLLMVLPIVGTVFKKVYYNPILKQNVSELCLPDCIFLNNNVESLDSARRITHKRFMYLNTIIENVRSGVYRDIVEEIEACSNKENEDPDAHHVVLEQHCYLDLDNDGYKEPYIVDIHMESRMVLRIAPRFDINKIKYNEKGKIISIPALRTFVDFHHIPAPDGTFFSYGFGHLMYPMNKTVNTSLNQMLDAATMANRQCGFVSKDFQGNAQSFRFEQGEWKQINVLGSDLSKSIYPLPVKEPSQVMFSLLGMMIQSMKEMSSMTEVLQGQQPAQNAPATTVLALIEQGLKMYSSFMKRLFRSLTKEFRILYKLNSMYLDDYVVFKYLRETDYVLKADFERMDISIYPVADPNLSSDAQRIARAEALMRLHPIVSPVGQSAIINNYLEAMQTPESLKEKILEPVQMPPDPKLIEAEAEAKKMEFEQATKQLEMALKVKEMEKSAEDSILELKLKAAQIKKLEAESVAILAKAESEGLRLDIGRYIDNLNELDDDLDKEIAPVGGEDDRESVTERPVMEGEPSDAVLPEPPVGGGEEPV